MNDSQKMYLHASSPVEIAASILKIAHEFEEAHEVLSEVGMHCDYFDPNSLVNLAFDVLGIPENTDLFCALWNEWRDQSLEEPDRVNVFLSSADIQINAWREDQGASSLN